MRRAATCERSTTAPWTWRFGDRGGGANTFELRMPVASAPEGLTFGSLVYVDGTEYGGIVDDVGSDTTGRIHKAVYGGRTWHGVLEGRVLRRTGARTTYPSPAGTNAVLLQARPQDGPRQAVRRRRVGQRDPRRLPVRALRRRLRGPARHARVRRREARHALRTAARWCSRPCPRRDWSREEFEGRRTPIKIKQASRPVNHLVCS